MNLPAFSLQHRVLVAAIAVLLALWGLIAWWTSPTASREVVQLVLFQVPLGDNEKIDPRYTYQGEQLDRMADPIIDDLKRLESIKGCELVLSENTEAQVSARTESDHPQAKLLVTLHEDNDLPQTFAAIQNRLSTLKSIERVIPPDVDVEIITKGAVTAADPGSASSLLLVTMIILVAATFLFDGWRFAVAVAIQLVVVALMSIALLRLFGIEFGTNVIVALAIGLFIAAIQAAKLCAQSRSNQTGGRDANPATSDAGFEMSKSRLASVVGSVGGFVPMIFIFFDDLAREAYGLPTTMLVVGFVVWLLTPTLATVLTAKWVRASDDRSSSIAPIPWAVNRLQNRIRASREQNESAESINRIDQFLFAILDYKYLVLGIVGIILGAGLIFFIASLSQHPAAFELSICYGFLLLASSAILVLFYKSWVRPAIIVIGLTSVLFGAAFGLTSDGSMLLSQLGVMVILGLAISIGNDFIMAADQRMAVAKRRARGWGPVDGLTVREFRECVVNTIGEQFLPMLAMGGVILAGLLPLFFWGEGSWTTAAWCMTLAMIATMILSPLVLATLYAIYLEHPGFKTKSSEGSRSSLPRVAEPVEIGVPRAAETRCPPN